MPLSFFFSPPQCINEEGFRQFLKTYLEVDFPPDLCQRLFRSFQNSKPTQEDGTSEIIYALEQLIPFTLQQALISLRYDLFAAQSFITARLFSTLCADMVTRVFTALSLSSICSVEEVFLKDVSCYFSLLEDGQPRDKLECKVLCFFSAQNDSGGSSFISVFSLVAFRLYDRDGNGVLDSSVSCCCSSLQCNRKDISHFAVDALMDVFAFVSGS